MKQMYRPDHVLSHFVHYSTITADVAQPYADFMKTQKSTNPQDFMASVRDRRWMQQSPEIFLNELTQGALVHARSVLPHETQRRTAECYEGSKYNCNLGYVCDDSVRFVDELHKTNGFHNPDGNFCNCWRNQVVDNVLVPQLKARMKI
jgi:hypothetical protein